MNKINQNNVLAHEIIGLKAKIRRGKKMYKGKIVNETKNMLSIKTTTKTIMLPKKEVEIELELPSKKRVLIKGETINFKPWERTKKLFGKKAKVINWKQSL